VRCVSDGVDGGWRLAGLSSAAALAPSSAAGGESTQLLHTLSPDVTLQPGDAASIFYLLQPPHAPAPAGGSSGAQHAPPAKGSVPVASGAPVVRGPLAHFYQAEKRAAAAAAHLAALAAGSVEDGGAASSSRQLLSDPPVDVLLLWRTRPVLAADGGAAAAGPGSAPPPPRMGLFQLFDACRQLRSSLVRVLLQPAQLSVVHDFRAHSMCVAPITLSVRNCGALPALLTIQVRGCGWWWWWWRWAPLVREWPRE
jgi:hypothetical protein